MGESAGRHDFYPDALLRRVLGSVRTVAMVGASPDWNRPSSFVMTYLQSKGNEAPARDVITAGKAMGFSESALKTARTRMSDRVKYERRKGMAGRSVSYWVLVSF